MPRRKLLRSREISPEQIKAAQRRHRQQEERARAQVRRFRPRKAERGSIVLVGTKGKRISGAQRGYAVYVTQTGKKWILHSGAIKEPFKARSAGEVELPITTRFRKAREKFFGAARFTGPYPPDVRHARRVIREKRLAGAAAEKFKQFLSSGRGRGRVSADTTTGGLNEAAIVKLARSLRKVTLHQFIRDFKIRVLALYQRGGVKETMEFTIPFARADNDVVLIEGVENFVRLKFYAFLARNLAALGYVTAGSANHIRRLAVNEGLDREDWLDNMGESWSGIDLETVKLLSIEWKIEQV